MHSTLEKKSNVCMYFLPSTLSSAIINSSLLREYLELFSTRQSFKIPSKISQRIKQEKKERERENGKVVCTSFGPIFIEAGYKG